MSSNCLPTDFQYWLSVSNLIRFHEHGVQFYSHTDTQMISGYTKYNCLKTANGLCQTGSFRFFECGDFVRSRLWDTESLASDTSALSLFWKHTMSFENECKNTLQYTLSDEHHDICMCDIRNGVMMVFKDYNIQILFDEYISQSWVYWTYIFLMFVLTLYLSESIATMFGDVRSISYSIVSSFLCATSVVFIICTSNVAFFITTHEKITYAFSVFYILSYSFYHLHRKVTFNMIIATLSLMFSRMYYSFEHMYSIPIIFILCVRTIQKCICSIYRKDAIELQVSVLDRTWTWMLSVLFISLDVFMVALLYLTGLADSCRDSTEPVLMIICIVFIAWIAARLLTSYVVDMKKQTTEKRST